ncbi:hypothetical protein AHAS_Ahas20G0186000 [Arachis hypogaea]
MATRGRGQTRTRRENEEGASLDNQTTLLATMTTLVNAMHANTVATNQAMERMNGNGNELRNHQADGDLMTLATFLKLNPPIFKGNGNESITWEMFKREFYKKYFSNSARQAKELELLQLKQESKMVATYTSKFEELCCFSRVC